MVKNTLEFGFVCLREKEAMGLFVCGCREEICASTKVRKNILLSILSILDSGLLKFRYTIVL
jgi:hypothetical protein